MPLDVARRGTLDVRDPPLKAIVADNDDYEAGYHKGNAGGLDAIDTDLATANIKNGITIFGKAGSADVLDVSDANALVGDVKDPKTFYSVTGPRKTGTMPTVAIVAANDSYPAGYHAGDVGGLDAIDVNLATANIKSGITIFGKAGSADVHDISDATAIAAEVITGETFYAVSGGIRTGTMPIVAITAVNDDYPAGYHAGNVGGLAAIDVNLAAANILSGVNIFGFVGPDTVQEIGAANAVLADVKNGKTFFSVTGGIKTGNLPTVALNPANSDYPAGYHAGDVGGLPAIDAQLVTGSIKFGITIFGVAGHTNVRDVSDANALVGEVKTGSTFYAVGGAKKTGTGTKTLSDANDTVAAGYYAATTLHDVDADLAVGNIKEGITIFGFLGTHAAGALAEDTLDSAGTTKTSDYEVGPPQGFCNEWGCAAGADELMATVTDTYDASSMAVAVGHLCVEAYAVAANKEKVRLYMDGVQVTESGFIPTNDDNIVVVGTRALSGETTCYVAVHNYDTSGRGGYL